MKTNKFILAGALAGALMLTTSCSDSFLEVKNPNGEPLEEYYTTDEHLLEALTAAYDPLHWPDWDGSAYNALNIDAEIDFRDITKKLHNDLKRFSPFGPGNTKPLFCTTDVYDYGTSKVVGREQEHIKLELVDSKSSNIVNGIAFGQSASARYIKSKRSFDIAYTIEDNVFKRNMVQLQIEDIRVAEED